MAKRRVQPQDRAVELLEKLLLLQLHAMGAPQGKIAKILGRQTAWVNAALRGLPKATKEK
jgi:hypothetical protein